MELMCDGAALLLASGDVCDEVLRMLIGPCAMGARVRSARAMDAGRLRGARAIETVISCSEGQYIRCTGDMSKRGCSDA